MADSTNISVFGQETSFTERANFYNDIYVYGTLYGNLVGNVTGNVTGNLVGNVTGNLVGNVTGNIYSIGISTFLNGPLLIGSASSTGTASQLLQVTGGAYISGNLGIGISSPGAKLDVNGSVRIRSSLLDRDNTPGSVGAFLRSDGTNIFWDNTPFGALLPTGPAGMVGVGTTSVDYYTGSIVRGYTMGGYQNNVAYQTVYKTNHFSDTTTNLGAILSYYAAYTDGTSSGRYGYSFDSHSSSVYSTAGKDINKLDMITDTNISFSTKMNANKSTNTNVVKYRFLRAYVFGDTDPEKFQFSTETPTVASTSWTNRNSLQWRQRAYGDDIAYFKTTNTGYQLTFASETWGSWTPGGAFGDGIWGCISTYAGYIYWKNSAVNWQKYNVINTSSVIINVTTPSQQEENYHTGESKGYMVGMYNGTGTNWQSTGGILDYINDTFRNVSSIDAPAINSSAACTEYGRIGL